MSDYTEFLRQKIKMASFKGFEVTPQLSARRSRPLERPVRRHTIERN